MLNRKYQCNGFMTIGRIGRAGKDGSDSVRQVGRSQDCAFTPLSERGLDRLGELDELGSAGSRTGWTGWGL